jgi:hypothetical protein
MGQATEWPLGLLLDEAWLRARRLLVTRMEGCGLLPNASEQRRFLETQRTRGEDIRDRVLLPVLGQSASEWLVSPSIFGAANRRFRAHTPLSLAFGYSVSELLQGANGGIDPQAADASALFNFGISMFDLLHDTLPELAPSFRTFFDEDRLGDLVKDAESAGRLAELASCATDPEIHLLLLTIAAVFTAIHHLSEQRGPAAAQVGHLMAMAYAAEAGSSRTDAHFDIEERLRVSREKSVLPFHIIRAIGRLRQDISPDADNLAERLGTVFWMVDDLADLVGDTRSHALNSLLLKANPDGTSEPEGALAALLAGNVIEDVVGEICDALVALQEVLLPSEGSGRVVPCYVRMWIE